MTLGLPARRRAMRGLRRNAWLGLTVVLVLGALVGTVAVVRSADARKDKLRQAQIALAALPGAVGAVNGQPQPLLAGRPPGTVDYVIDQSLRGQLLAATDAIQRVWPGPRAAALTALAQLIAQRTASIMTLLAAHRRVAANAEDSSAVRPARARLEADIAADDGFVERQAAAAVRAGDSATLITVGVAGLLLLTLVVGTAAGRRREAHMELEHAILRESENRLRALVEHGSDVIAVVDDDAAVAYAAGPAVALLGCEPSLLEGADLTQSIHEQDRAPLLALCRTTHSDAAELRLRHADGSERACEVHATRLADGSGWRGVVLNVWDVSGRKLLEEQLRHQAFHDGLTGLPNRSLAIDRARNMLAGARRRCRTLAVLYIDLDGFKAINDTLGHAAGDELLRQVAERLSLAVRDCDTAARLGGDEFLVLLEDCTETTDATTVATRIIQALRQPFHLGLAQSEPVCLGASIGISRGRDLAPEELIRTADAAMYDAKQTGGNRYALSGSEQPVAPALRGPAAASAPRHA